VRHVGLFWRTVEPIESHEGEFRAHAAWLVRPRGIDANQTWAAVAPDGLVVGLVGNFAYRAAMAGATESVANGEIEKLPPFRLFGASGEGSEDDVVEMAQAARSGQGLNEADVLAALDHANPWVRDAAKRIVEAGGAQTNPQATKRLASSPDVGTGLRK